MSNTLTIIKSSKNKYTIILGSLTGFSCDKKQLKDYILYVTSSHEEVKKSLDLLDYKDTALFFSRKPDVNLFELVTPLTIHNNETEFYKDVIIYKEHVISRVTKDKKVA